MWRLLSVWNERVKQARGGEKLTRTKSWPEESEHKLALILNQMSDGFVALDEAWHFTHVNAAAAEYLETTPETLLGRRLWDVFPETIDSPLHENLRRVMEAGALVEFEQYCVTRGVWYAMRSLRVPEGVILFLRDITEKKRADQALRRSEEARRLALEAAEVGTWHQDLVTQEVVGDERAEALFGIRANLLTCHSLLQVVHPEDRAQVEQAMQQALSTEPPGPCAMEYRIALPDSTIRWVAVRCRVYFEARGGIYRASRLVGTVRDVTERKRAELGLRQARDELAFLNAELEKKVEERTVNLREALAEMEHMSYSMVHDMRAPLRAMNSYASLMLRSEDASFSQQNQDFLQRIVTAAIRLDHLLTDALNFSKAARQELPLEPVDAGALLRGMLSTYPQFQSPRAEIQLEGKVTPVIGNQGALTQCFSHLLENALKFVEPGKVPRVRIRAEEEPGKVRIWFEDNGLGIPRSGQSRIFDMYQQMHTGYGGTGIGLAVVRKLAERMGGKIGVESEPGKGSRFWLEFRAAQREPGGAQSVVLYIEDEENDVFFLQHSLESLGLGRRLRVVRDGEEAIHYLSGTGLFADRQKYPLPVLVILDLELPKVPGLRVLQWMREQAGLTGMPVVVLSGSGQVSDREEAQRLGSLLFVSKSSDAAQFRRLAQRIQQQWLA